MTGCLTGRRRAAQTICPFCLYPLMEDVNIAAPSNALILLSSHNGHWVRSHGAGQISLLEILRTALLDLSERSLFILPYSFAAILSKVSTSTAGGKP